MSSETGTKIKVTIFGESHGEAIGAVVDNLPSGERIDYEELLSFMKRRQGGNNPYSTPRKEADVPEIISGIKDGVTTGAPLCVLIKNQNVRSADYKIDIPRPGHADFTSYVKYNGYSDLAGGGHFSGRLTAPICAVGGILIQILKRYGITITSHLASVGEISDDKINDLEYDKLQEGVKEADFPVFNKESGEKMQEYILNAKKDGDSVGGVVECAVYGFPPGIGNPLFDGLENRIASSVFALGGVRGIEFGNGFEASKMRGSENNDEFYMDEDTVKTKTNNHGGILGGISSGMPIVFKTAFKPTPSISKPQNSISLKRQENTELKTEGRHDPCIAVRAVPCVEAITAIAISDFIL